MASGDLIANGVLGMYPLIPVSNDSVKQRTGSKVFPEAEFFKTTAGIYKASENYPVFWF